MANSELFHSTGIHRSTTIKTKPELVRIKYLDVIPQDGTKVKGTILLIHGFPQTSYQFRKVIPSLSAAGYRVVAPDTRGCGDSSKPMILDDYRKIHIAEDFRFLLQGHLGIGDPVHVVGHDIGGMIAHAYANAFPKDTASVTWGECPLPSSSEYEETKGSVKQFHFSFHQILDLPETLIKNNERAYLKHFYDKLGYNALGITPADLDYYTAQYSQPGAIRGGINAYRMFEEDATDNRRVLKENGKCKVRCMVLNGAAGGHAPQAKKVAEEFYENFEVVEIDNAGHWIAEENPEDFVREVKRFIEKS
ncbi:hypothetical protein H2198_007475 [Neophaeococcomyces mojaviensis]|uniref:Uncharacterized protein n=1 Tax=Neophaeococcomyces mojaviensis TaxID=3383035 RepID=A0ACC2ZZX3_9EURO|nr:hypothetical protein H2198_007475 [Knufia sp. JES_112]